MNAKLDALHAEHSFTVVINGGQVSRDRDVLYGADHQVAVWAQSRGLPVLFFYANWTGEGKAAGPIRNQRMIEEGCPELGVEFPGRNGTKNMRGKLDRAGIRVIEPMKGLTA